MSIYSAEILPKISEISKTHVKSFNDGLKDIFESFDKYEEELQNGTSQTREKVQKDKLAMTTLQSINEDEDTEPLKSDPEPLKSAPKDRTSIKSDSSTSSNNSERRASKKRGKNEVDGIFSPEQDKRQKRKASVIAQSIISKQVNVNLTQKLRRENSSDKLEKNSKGKRTQRHKDDDKENSEPNQIIPVVQIKQEKLSIPEPMETESLPVNIEIKPEINKDDIAMPPPPPPPPSVPPVPKPRKGLQEEKSNESNDEDNSSKKRTTRTRKHRGMPLPPPLPVPSARSTRSSNRVRRTDTSQDLPPPQPRPKRTRAKKKASLTPSKDSEKESQESVSATSSPAEKPRPKRTRRNKITAEKPEPTKEPEQIPVTMKEERISSPKIHSPILQKDIKPKKGKINPIPIAIEASLQDNHDKTEVNQVNTGITNNTISQDKVDLAMDETRIISKLGDMDKTMVLPNGVYNHAPVTPKNVLVMNETVVIDKDTINNATVVIDKDTMNNATVVIDKDTMNNATVVIDKDTMNNATVVIDKPNNAIMDATVVLDKGPKDVLTADNSLLTDDSDYHDAQTPPKSQIPVLQPTSAVKEKVQQFEELASRVTRTKTRAMAKKEEQQSDTHTPPDRKIKPVLSADTLNKMNNLIFNGKHTLMSNSDSKPRAIPVKTAVPSSTSKLTSSRTTDVEERNNKVEDPRQKKEAMLEAKRELQRRKREEKMAAAAAAREAAERERLAAVNAAVQERKDKLAHVQAGKVARLKEVERKKLESARKLAETEERRRAEETARLQRLAEEQKRAEQQRRKQIEEQLQMKKEEARMAKEIEKRQKEYIEKQKLKQRKDDKCRTPCRTPGTPGGYPPPAPCEPVYMQDGFQYLNSDEDEEPPARPPPPWSTSKARKLQLDIQSQISSVHIDRLFSVRVHNPDLVELFPNIDRHRLKRTSSAVWRTPPHLAPVKE